MPIDDAALLKFVDESVRTLADKAAGVFGFVDAFLEAARGKGVAALLGTDDETLFRSTPWEQSDFAACLVGGEPVAITGSDDGGRTLLTNVDVLAMIRLAQWLKNAKAADPAIGPQVAKVAVNPRA